MPSANLEISGITVDIQNATVRITEHSSTAAAPGAPVFPATSNKLIQTDQAWDIWFKWDQVAGSFLLNGGEWVFDVYLEMMGPDEAPATKGHFAKKINANPVDGNNFQTYVHINAGEVPEGTYRIVVSQQFYSLGKPRAIAMFGDIGLVKFYKEEV